MAGSNLGTIRQAISNVSVSSSNTALGGLVGYNSGEIDDSYNTGSVTGGIYVGGLVGFDTGTVNTCYSTGPVSGVSTVGGLLGATSGTTTASFWDTDTSGQGSGIGSGSTAGITGATTAQLTSQTYIASVYGANAYDFTNVWTTVNGTLTPQLIGLPQTVLPSGSDILSGTAFIDSGMTPNNSGTTIDLIFDGTLLGSTTTNGSGGFSFSVSASDLTGGILLSDTSTSGGNTYYQSNNPTSVISGIDIWANTIRVVADTASNSALITAAGSLTNGVDFGSSNGNLISQSCGFNLASNYTLSGNISGKFITIGGPVTSTSASPITLSSTTNITIGANITNSAGGAITLQADDGGSGIGTVSFGNGAQVSTSGAVSIFYNPSVNPAGSAINGTSYVNPTENFAPDVAGGGTLTAYMLVNTLNDLQNMENNLSGTYALSHNIDATPTASWNGGSGFNPVGTNAASFSGTFNGQGYAIDGLTINTPSGYEVALFGNVTDGVLENFGVTNLQISGTDYVGGVVGYNQGGTIKNVYATGTLTGPINTDAIGGLVGDNTGTIIDSYTTVAVNAPQAFGNVGGGVGVNYGTISDCYATGVVNGASGDDVGGFIGQESGGTVTNCYSTGYVTGTGEVGGFIGVGSGTVANCFWDTDTSGQVLGTGDGTLLGETGATTAQLSSQAFILANATTSPTFDFTNVWTTVGDTLTPQLIGLPQTSLPTGGSGLDTLSGTAFIDSGMTANNSGTVIDLVFDGSMIGSTTTNSSGGFSFSVSPTDLTGGVLLIDSADIGNTYYQANASISNITGVDIWGSALRVIADTASNAALGTAAGGASGVNYTVNAGALSTNMGVQMQVLSHYTFDGDINVPNAAFSTGSAAVVTGSNDVTLAASSMNLGGTITDTGTVTFNSGSSITPDANISVGGFILENGLWTQIVNPNLTALPTFTDSGDFELQNGSTFGRFAGGLGTTGTPYQIVDIFGLQGLNSPSGVYLSINAVLNNNIDATATSGWNLGAGFAPIGFNSAYTAVFNGQGFTINGLNIDRPGMNAVGLFSVATDLLENVNLTNVQVDGGTYVGGLAGATGNTSSGVVTTGIVQNCSSSGTVTAGGSYVGGLVGLDHGTLIVSSYTAGQRLRVRLRGRPDGIRGRPDQR